MNIKSWFSPIKWKEKLQQYRRVISISRKPDKEEYTSSAKIIGAGILLVGFIGFVMFLLYQLVMGGFA